MRCSFIKLILSVLSVAVSQQKFRIKFVLYLIGGICFTFDIAAITRFLKLRFMFKCLELSDSTQCVDLGSRLLCGREQILVIESVCLHRYSQNLQIPVAEPIFYSNNLFNLNLLYSFWNACAVFARII